GVYDDDPKKNPNAKRFETVSYDRVLADNLKVMDASAVALCRDNDIPIVAFSIREKANLARVLTGEGVQTIVRQEGRYAQVRHGRCRAPHGRCRGEPEERSVGPARWPRQYGAARSGGGRSLRLDDAAEPGGNRFGA